MAEGKSEEACEHCRRDELVKRKFFVFNRSSCEELTCLHSALETSLATKTITQYHVVRLRFPHSAPSDSPEREVRVFLYPGDSPAELSKSFKCRKWPDRIMTLFLRGDELDEVLGDLSEELETKILPKHGLFFAGFWYWRHCLGAAVKCVACGLTDKTIIGRILSAAISRIGRP